MALRIRSEMADIAGVDCGNRQHNEDVGRAKLSIDHCTVTDKSAGTQVAFDQRG